MLRLYRGPRDWGAIEQAVGMSVNRSLQWARKSYDFFTSVTLWAFHFWLEIYYLFLWASLLDRARACVAPEVAPSKGSCLGLHASILRLDLPFHPLAKGVSILPYM